MLALDDRKIVTFHLLPGGGVPWMGEPQLVLRIVQMTCFGVRADWFWTAFGLDGSIGPLLLDVDDGLSRQVWGAEEVVLAAVFGLA